MLPEWCRVRRGKGRLLFVAPHGGKRRKDELCGDDGRRLKINDLGTAELASELALRTDGSLLANVALDRNVLDLNRVSAVRREAPWFLDELRSLIEGILAEHEMAEILVLHGWHVVQPKCDVGIGACLAGESDDLAAAERLTVSREYLCGRLAAFRATAEARSIAVAYGERYPGSHPENLLQLFRCSADAATGPFAAWAATGRTAAVQLELGVPLRWPGSFRQSFVESVVEVFGSEKASPSPALRATSPQRGEVGDPPLPLGRGRRTAPGEGEPPAPALGVRVHDAASGLAVVAGISPNGDGAIGGRLLLVGDDGVVLFTGEERQGPPIGGLTIRPKADGMHVRFRGPAVAVDDGDLYLRTEAALQRAELVTVTADLRYHAGAMPDYGSVSGEVTVGERRWLIAAPGFADATFARGVGGDERRGLALAASFGRELGFTVRLAGTAAPRAARLGDDAAPLEAVLEALDASGVFTSACFRLSDGSRLTAEPASRISILRPIGPRAFARISLGVARFALDSGEESVIESRRLPLTLACGVPLPKGRGQVDRVSLQGSGFYEYAEAWP